VSELHRDVMHIAKVILPEYFIKKDFHQPPDCSQWGRIKEK